MATRKKPLLIARVGLSKKKYVKRPSQITRKAPSKRLTARRKVNKVGTGRFPNPSTQARAAAASRWAEFAAAKNLSAKIAKDGAYVIQTMPDPSRIKDFSALAQMMGARMTNPPPKKRRALRKPSSPAKGFGGATGNFAVAKQVRGKTFVVDSWHREQDIAIHRAEAVADKTGKEVYVLTRAKYNELLRH